MHPPLVGIPVPLSVSLGSGDAPGGKELVDRGCRELVS